VGGTYGEKEKEKVVNWKPKHKIRNAKEEEGGGDQLISGERWRKKR